MNLKSFLRGLGIGIFFTTIIMFVAHKSSSTMTDDEIKNRAKQLGMVATTEENSDLSSILNDENTENSTDESSSESSETSVEVTTEDTTEGTTENKTEDTTAVTTEGSSDSASKKFTISSGMDSQTVAETLYGLGMIEDAEDFDQYLINNGFSQRIRTGDYTVNEGDSYESIANLITNR